MARWGTGIPASGSETPHVVATAGHVDHGKSSLVRRLTGTDPDRLVEEKRRGLTIDLGFAWCTLASGAEIGFVDVPGHERFVRNMLAGVGPVRLVLFVVAADEGWKPQSEEHLLILDVLGIDAGVIALTKRDLVDDETLAIAEDEIRGRVAGTALATAPIVPCSATSGEGIDRLRATLDAMIASAPRPGGSGRARLFVDRVFKIAGAGTVVTGTLTGGPLEVGGDVALLPAGTPARIRGLQTHRRSLDRALPVSRVAVNLVGADRADVRRGDVLVQPGRWRASQLFEGSLALVRDQARSLSSRGAYKLYVGSAERDARVRIYGAGRIAAGERGFARLRLSEPVVIDVGDRFVLREVGRRETVAGGVVLDVAPPRHAGPAAEVRLQARALGGRAELPSIVVGERGAVRADELALLTGIRPESVVGARSSGAWWVTDAAVERVTKAVVATLGAFHGSNPLRPGLDLGAARSTIAKAARSVGAPSDPALAEALLDAIEGEGALVREGTVVRLPDHPAQAEVPGPELERLSRAVAVAEPTPPTIGELLAAGHRRDVLDAAFRRGALVRVGPDLVFTPGFVERAVQTVRAAGSSGITVSVFRERLGTSRRYAVPLLEHLDQRGMTARRGDVRVARASNATR